MNTALVPKASAAPGQVLIEASDETLHVEIGSPGDLFPTLVGYVIFGGFQATAFAWLWHAVSHTDGRWAWAVLTNVGASLATWRWTAQRFNRTTIDLNRQRGCVAYRPFGFRWTFTTARVAATIGTRNFEGTDYSVVELSFDRKNVVVEMTGHAIENLRWLCDIFNLWTRGELQNGSYRR